jgi:Mg2+ and Co2+ transporter CorA
VAADAPGESGDVDVRVVNGEGVSGHSVDELPALLKREDGIVWVDIPAGDPQAAPVLSDVFGFHPLAVRGSVERNRVPKVHAYPDHIFVVLHAPELGASGHVHFIELDQFVGRNYLVTVHGPLNPAVNPEVAYRETGAVVRRLQAGKLRPESPFDLSYAIVSALTRHQEAYVEEVTREVWQLEQRVMGGHMGNREQFLDELFRTRHGLLAVRTISTLSGAIYGRMAALTRFVPADARPLIIDIIDQFDRVRAVAAGEMEYLQGVIEFHRAGTETKTTIAAERLAVIAVVTLPITAISSVMGMNIIVNEATDFWFLAIMLGIMATISAVLLTWAKRQGWW